MEKEGTMLVLGAPGMGKSSLLAQLFKQLRAGLDGDGNELSGTPPLVIEYFIRRGEKTASASHFLRRLCERLDALFELPASKIGENVPEMRAALEARLGQIEDLGKNRRTVLFLDGLDEGLEIIPEFPCDRSWLNLLCAGRPVPGVMNFYESRDPDKRSSMQVGPLKVEDARAMLAEAVDKYDERFDERYVEGVMEKSRGSPLYLKLLCSQLFNGTRQVGEVDDLPRQMSELYGEVLRRVSDQGRNEEVLDLLHLLTEAKESLSVPVIAEFLGVNATRADALVRDCGELLLEDPLTPEIEDFQLFHESMREWLRENHPTECRRMADKLCDLCFEWTSRLIPEASSYALARASVHLLEKGDHERLWLLLRDEDFRSRQFADKGGYDGCFEALEHGLAVYVGLDGALPEYDARLCWLALRTEELGEQARKPDDPIARMTELPLQDPDRIPRALESIKYLDDEKHFLCCLLMLWIEADRQVAELPEDRFPEHAEQILSALEKKLPQFHTMGAGTTPWILASVFEAWPELEIPEHFIGQHRLIGSSIANGFVRYMRYMRGWSRHKTYSTIMNEVSTSTTKRLSNLAVRVCRAVMNDKVYQKGTYVCLYAIELFKESSHLSEAEGAFKAAMENIRDGEIFELYDLWDRAVHWRNCISMEALDEFLASSFYWFFENEAWDGYSRHDSEILDTPFLFLGFPFLGLIYKLRGELSEDSDDFSLEIKNFSGKQEKKLFSLIELTANGFPGAHWLKRLSWNEQRIGKFTEKQIGFCGRWDLNQIQVDALRKPSQQFRSWEAYSEYLFCSQVVSPNWFEQFPDFEKFKPSDFEEMLSDDHKYVLGNLAIRHEYVFGNLVDREGRRKAHLVLEEIKKTANIPETIYPFPVNKEKPEYSLKEIKWSLLNPGKGSIFPKYADPYVNYLDALLDSGFREEAKHVFLKKIVRESSKENINEHLDELSKSLFSSPKTVQAVNQIPDDIREKRQEIARKAILQMVAAGDYLRARDSFIHLWEEDYDFCGYGEEASPVFLSLIDEGQFELALEIAEHCLSHAQISEYGELPCRAFCCYFNLIHALLKRDGWDKAYRLTEEMSEDDDYRIHLKSIACFLLIGEDSKLEPSRIRELRQKGIQLFFKLPHIYFNVHRNSGMGDLVQFSVSIEEAHPILEHVGETLDRFIREASDWPSLAYRNLVREYRERLTVEEVVLRGEKNQLSPGQLFRRTFLYRPSSKDLLSEGVVELIRFLVSAQKHSHLEEIGKLCPQILQGLHKVAVRGGFQNIVDLKYITEWKEENRSFENLNHLSGSTNLRRLEIRKCQSLTNVEGLSGLTNLTSFRLHGCSSLTNVACLSGCTKLTELRLQQCKSLTNMDASGLTNLTDLDLTGCSSLTTLEGLSGLTNLTELRLESCSSLTNVDVSGLTNLTDLDLTGCSSLTTLEGLSGLTNLKEARLGASSCESFLSLGDIIWKLGLNQSGPFELGRFVRNDGHGLPERVDEPYGDETL